MNVRRRRPEECTARPSRRKILNHGKHGTTQRGRAAERFLTTENTEQYGKEIRMCFHFCVLPGGNSRPSGGVVPWLLPVLTIAALRNEIERYYPGTEEAHTNPTRQRGECLRALAGASG